MLKQIRQRFSKFIKSKKINVFGLFLLLSFSILMFTKLSQKFADTLTLTINPENLPENIIINQDSLAEVDVTFSDYGFKLLYYSFKNLKLPVDLNEDAARKNNSYLWLPKNSSSKIESFLGDSAEVISVSPDSIIFSFDTLSVKKVAVNLKSKILYASGYDKLDAVSISPDSIQLIGAAKEISKINAISTKMLEMDKVKNNVETSIELELPENSKKIKFSKEEVSVFIPVDKFTEGTLDVPVIVNNLPADTEINYFPKTIKVAYYVSLNNYKSIKASDFKIDCNYNEAKGKNQSFFTPNLTIKSNKVKTARMKQDKVEYIIVQ